MSTPRINVFVFGGSTINGGEVLRLLRYHPGVDLIGVSGDQVEGKPVTAVHPHLHHLKNEAFVNDQEGIKRLGYSVADTRTVAICAWAWSETAYRLSKVLDRFGRNPNFWIVDLAADFRFDSAARFEQAFPGGRHGAKELIGSFAYGLPEWPKAELATARRIAVPGAHATAISLALLPAIVNDVVAPSISVTAVAGYTAIPPSATPAPAHAGRPADIQNQNAVARQQLPEVLQVLEGIAPAERIPSIALVTQRSPFARGVYVTAAMHATVPGADAIKTYHDFYAKTPLVECVEVPPPLSAVIGSARAQINAEMHGQMLIVTCALDSLGKGSAGHAIHAMNLALDFPETTGIDYPAFAPI
jgi:N-acetyl-gamma-glutamyl-phosphate reductase